MKLALLPVLLLLPRIGFAQDTNADAPTPAPPKPAAVASAKPAKPGSVAQLQATIDKLTQSNRDLLDLLKQQQQVLQDIQFDRRQQARHIQSIEERLEEALEENAKLREKVSTLAADAAVHPAVALQPLPSATNGAANANSSATAPAQAAAAPEPPPVPAPPASFLPPAGADGPPGTKSWHRLFALKGTEGQRTDLFHIQGHNWRVLWHNQDPPEKNFKGTSGLFVDAFPKDDTIPQHVCAKVGTGGDEADLIGSGNYYLKITASGGSWELAVEDLR